MTFNRILIGAIALTVALLTTLSGAAAFDETKYPNFEGQWKRKLGTVNAWDESKRPGLPQDPPLIPEYRKMWLDSMADQAAGGQGLDTRFTCITNGMPRIMGVIQPIQFVILPKITYVHFEAFMPRRIYTDGRDFPTGEEPSFMGYSIGNWTDADASGRFNTLEVETRLLKGPRAYDFSGIPLHADNETVVKERIYLDKANPNILHDEITVIDNALTRPWTVDKKYIRDPKDARPEWDEAYCTEDSALVGIGKEIYWLGGDGMLMPARKDQPPPDLRHFKQTQQTQK
jgi:hypothetical protein